MGYTREQIILRLEELSSNMSLLYKQGCINYRGKTTDTGEYYTEVIARWLLEHLDLLEQIPTITRESPYFVAGHDGEPDDPNSIREEELIAMAMKRQGSMPVVGEVLDYQTPLKNARKDKAGKIDLLTCDGATIRILELKTPDSKETMLRCVLEGYTYWKVLNKTKLIADHNEFFGKAIPENTPIVACPFVFRGGSQWKEMRQDRPYLKQLMEMLHSKPYYISKQHDRYVITEE